MLGERRWSWNQQRGPLSSGKQFRKGEIWYVRSNSIDSSLTMYVIQDPRRLTLRTLLVFCLHLDSEVKVIALIRPTLPTSYLGKLSHRQLICAVWRFVPELGAPEVLGPSYSRSSLPSSSSVLTNNVRVGSLCTTAKLFAGREKLLELLFVLETRFIM